MRGRSQLLTGVGVWPQLAAALTGAGRRGTSRAYLAIAYIGLTADTWLPLRPGDVVVCDAGVEAVQLGLTSVDQLRRWHAAGVELFSQPGLHAKAGVIGTRAFVGSANASRRSAEEREEVAVVISDGQLAAELRSYIKTLTSSPALALNEAVLRQLAAVPVRQPRWPRPSRRGALAVPDEGRFWIVPWEDDPRSRREIKQLKELEHQHAGVLSGADYLDDLRLDDARELDKWRLGDVVVFSNPGVDEQAYPPAVVVEKLRPNQAQRAAIVYRVRGDLKCLRSEEVEAAICAVDPSWRRRGSRTSVPVVARAALAALDWSRITERSLL